MQLVNWLKQAFQPKKESVKAKKILPPPEMDSYRKPVIRNPAKIQKWSESEEKQGVGGIAILEPQNTEQLLQKDIMEMPEQRIISPTVEHPLLSIQDKLSKVEELTRIINERLINLDTKVATKEEIKELGKTVKDEGDRIVGTIDERLTGLYEKKAELTRQLDMSTHQFTNQLTHLTQIEGNIQLLEADKKILRSLKDKAKSTLELSKDVKFSRQYLWNRLKELEDEGYVEKIKSGRRIKYKTTPKFKG